MSLKKWIVELALGRKTKSGWNLVLRPKSGKQAFNIQVFKYGMLPLKKSLRQNQKHKQELQSESTWRNIFQSDITHSAAHNVTKGFSEEIDLNKPERIHTREKPYSCSQCVKKQAWKNKHTLFSSHWYCDEQVNNANHTCNLLKLRCCALFVILTQLTFLHFKKNLYESYVGIKYTHTHTHHLLYILDLCKQ